MLFVFSRTRTNSSISYSRRGQRGRSSSSPSRPREMAASYGSSPANVAQSEDWFRSFIVALLTFSPHLLTSLSYFMSHSSAVSSCTLVAPAPSILAPMASRSLCYCLVSEQAAERAAAQDGAGMGEPPFAGSASLHNRLLPCLAPSSLPFLSLFNLLLPICIRLMFRFSFRCFSHLSLHAAFSHRAQLSNDLQSLPS